jgi:glycosyltransferase involved in cell wall biosynthesis
MSQAGSTAGAMSTPDATILFTTKNRRDELARGVASALAQRGAAVEVLVVDDGSTDGTAEMLARDFPAARVVRHAESAGYIARRNEGARLASAPVVFSLDDDAAFSDPGIVADILRQLAPQEFGAIAIPYVDVLYGPQLWTSPPDAEGVWVASEYRGTAHAFKRELFLSLGGYRESLIHQGEEVDYAYRLVDAGYLIRAGWSRPIHHFESPNRDRTRQRFYSARNNLLLIWHSAPMPEALVVMAVSGLRLLLLAARQGYLRTALRGTWAALVECATGRAERKPVSRRAFRLFRRLRSAGSLRLADIRPGWTGRDGRGGRGDGAGGGVGGSKTG